MSKSSVRIICFISILVMVLGYVNKIFKVKYDEGIYGLTSFYEQEDNKIDVLFLGSSHAYVGFNTGTLWDEYGIASYVLGGAIQPMWNSYYYLKEALKTQTPELIVLEGFSTAFRGEYTDDGRIIKNNYGLRWSGDKIDAIKVSAPEERWTEFLLEYMQYHTRYTELSASDFLKNKNNSFYDDWKGFFMLMHTSSLEAVDVSGVTERAPLLEKTEQYYRAIIELAQMNNIPITVVVSPFAGISGYYQQHFNTASDIASEYGIPFLNCNLLCDEIGIDYAVDAADTDHLNYKGTQKYSSFIGSYLVSHFDISDRRGDVSYESWQRHASYIAQMIKDQILIETSDLEGITEKLQDPNYWLFITVDGNCTTSDENLQSFFYTLGLPPADGSYGIWYRNTEGWVWYSQMEEAEQYIQTAHDFCMRRTADDAGVYTNAVIIDNIQYKKVTNGVNIVVYDTATEKVVTTIGINLDDGYNVIQ